MRALHVDGQGGMTGLASPTVDKHPRHWLESLRVAWKPLLAMFLLFVLFFEVRALVRIHVVETPATAVLQMADAGLIVDARVSAEGLYVEPRADGTAPGAAVRGAVGLPAAGRWLVVRTSDDELAMLVGRLRAQGISVSETSPERY